MKILQINSIYGSKSTGVIVRDIHKQLKKEKISSKVLAPFVSEPDDDVISMRFRLEEKAHAIITRLFGLQGLGSCLQTKKYLKAIDGIKPDIIHIHNIHSNFINYSMLLKYTAAKKIPVLFTLHDSWLFTGKCYHFLDIGCDKWKTECGSCPKRYKEIKSVMCDNSKKVFRLRKKLYEKNALYVVGCSKWISDLAKQSPLFQNAKKHLYIHNGIDVGRFSDIGENFRSNLGLNGKFVIMAMANKWFDPKNTQFNAELIQNLAEEDRILIVGCNENQHYDNEKVIQIGYINGCEELAKYYRTADLFLNLTYVDTLPTVNMEASACGLPIITFDSGGCAELINPDVTGYITSPGDVKQVLEAIGKIKGNAILKENCRDWAVKNFNKEANYNKYIDLYKQCFNEKGH